VPLELLFFSGLALRPTIGCSDGRGNGLGLVRLGLGIVVACFPRSRRYSASLNSLESPSDKWSRLYNRSKNSDLLVGSGERHITPGTGAKVQECHGKEKIYISVRVWGITPV
jgi:hypothetical protein